MKQENVFGSGNYLGLFAPYLTEGKSNTWGDSLNLDGPLSDEVRRYVVENLLMWFRDYHVDGKRTVQGACTHPPSCRGLPRIRRFGGFAAIHSGARPYHCHPVE